MFNDITLLRFRDLKAAGIVPNRTTLTRWLKRKTDPFPRPIHLGDNFVAWRLIDIEAWLERRAAASRTGSAE
jgi:predicted DNA-binding transcriptional regulator AlpA